MSSRTNLLVYFVLFFLMASSPAFALVVIPQQQIVSFANENLFVGDEVFIVTKKPYTLALPQGNLELTAGFFFIMREKSGERKVTVQVLRGEGQFVQKISRQVFHLVPFSQFSIAPKSEVSVIQVLDFSLHLKAFNKHFRPGKSQMLRYAEILHQRIKHSREQIGDFYQGLYLRSLASSKQEESDRLHHRKNAALAKNQIRKKYESKVFGEELPD